MPNILRIIGCDDNAVSDNIVSKLTV